MRILYSHRIGSRDGQSLHIDELVTALRNVGHEVLVVGPSLYDDMAFGSDSGAIVAIRRYLPKALNEMAELAYNVLAYRQLRRACRSFKPDLIYERYNLFYLAGTLLARRANLPLYLEVNSPLAYERSRHGGLQLQRLAHRLERYVWRGALRVLAVTEVLKATIARAGVPPERISVTHNGIHPDQFAALPARVPDADPVVLGFIGFMREWHGLDRLVDAMAQHEGPALRLIIAGEGPARPALERQVAALGLQGQVSFTGLADRASVPLLLGSFDIALQPRVVDYASPLKIFEYMAAGCAIVAPDQPNIREILTDHENALLVDPEDPQAMWAAITRLIADSTLRQRLGNAAREAIRQHDYTWDGNARRITAWVHEDLRAEPGAGKTLP